MSRCAKIVVKSLPPRPQPTSDKASLKPPSDRNGPLAAVSVPESVPKSPEEAAATAAAAAATVAGCEEEAFLERQYPADRRRLEMEKKPVAPRRANRFRATCSTLGNGRVGGRRVVSSQWQSTAGQYLCERDWGNCFNTGFPRNKLEITVRRKQGRYAGIVRRSSSSSL